MIILIGASASGKTEVAKLLATKYNIKKVVTHTTRPIRINEVDNVDYHFVSKENFLKLSSQDFFVETAQYNGNFYGTSKAEVADNKALIVEANGLKAFKKSGLKNIVSFKLVADEKVRYQRMLNRGDSESDAISRISNDKIKFSDENIGSVDFEINTDNLSIEEVTKLIFEKYTNQINR